MTRYITPQKAFAHLDRLAAWKAGHRAAPVTIEWDLSNACTLSCQDCHFSHTHVKGPWASKPRNLPLAYDSTGTFADIELVKRSLADMHRAGVRGVIWSGGGEPTVHPSWLVAVDAAASLGFEQGMYTLGGLLTSESVNRLADAATWVVVSLDTCDAETYGAEKGVSADKYHAACDGIKSLASRGKAVVGVSFLLHINNWRNAAKMKRVALEELGANYVTFRPSIHTSPASPANCANDSRRWIDDAWPTLQWLERQEQVECSSERFAAYRDWNGRDYDACHGIKLTATVTPDGRVWVCPQRRGIAGSELGDLRTETFDEIWSRHPGAWTDFRECRVMCRLHLTNEILAPMFAARTHEAFV